jgi:hypothetical protein
MWLIMFHRVPDAKVQYRSPPFLDKKLMLVGPLLNFLHAVNFATAYPLSLTPGQIITKETMEEI